MILYAKNSLLQIFAHTKVIQVVVNRMSVNKRYMFFRYLFEFMACYLLTKLSTVITAFDNKKSPNPTKVLEKKLQKLPALTLVILLSIIIVGNSATAKTTSYSEADLSKFSPKLVIGVIEGKSVIKSHYLTYERSCMFHGLNRSYRLLRANPSILVKYVQEEGENARASYRAAKKLKDAGVDLAVLHLRSPEAEAAADYLSSQGIPFITSASNMSVIKPGYKGLSIGNSNRSKAAMLTAYYKKNFKGRPIYITENVLNPFSIEMGFLFRRAVSEMVPGVRTESVPIGILGSETEDVVRRMPENAFIFSTLNNPRLGTLFNEISKQGKRNIVLIGSDATRLRKEFLSYLNINNHSPRFLFISQWDRKSNYYKHTKIRRIADLYCNNSPLSNQMLAAFDMYQLIQSVEPKVKAHMTSNELLSLLRSSKYTSVLDGKKIAFSKNGYNEGNMFLYEIDHKKHANLVKKLHYYNPSSKE